jgi:hypothetical protein
VAYGLAVTPEAFEAKQKGYPASPDIKVIFPLIQEIPDNLLPKPHKFPV